MPANKNALIRYKTIDNCLRNRYRRWTIEDLVDACSEALYDMEGITKGVSLRTIQGDLQMMRSDKLGYYAPIEVYDNKQFSEISDVVGRLQDKMAITRKSRRPVIHFDSVPSLKGLRLLNPLYNHIVCQQTLKIHYQPYKAEKPRQMVVYPYMLKEFRNRWFLMASAKEDMLLQILALDRITGIEVEEKIPWRDNPDFDAEHYFDNIIGVSKAENAKPRTITFWASPTTRHYIQTKPIHSSQQLIEENEDGSAVFKIEVIVNFEMYSVFMSYGTGIKVLSPEKSVNFIKNELSNWLKMYEELNFPTII